MHAKQDTMYFDILSIINEADVSTDGGAKLLIDISG